MNASQKEKLMADDGGDSNEVTKIAKGFSFLCL